ncbi:DNA translocase FtsK [Gracilinema caldarium]|uniref:Cell division protein FtsK/SpoIIIE n=1 Tax=Gracilinema caldarium (strain ATCC 51460 / DSM 7334 / H1) TaxID=744872 RepID=F8EWZ8_GRAC1|nr:DNA translocase FtsK [Gracilinema caldarium]AEJ18525.1 cell division protein FtsK/SpoIIIE [Gracilinema caldarium DSM 7334]
MARPIHPSKTALTLSVILGSASLILALAITSAYLALPFLIVKIGQFCIDAYGILSYWLPIYLFIAALLLSDNYYRPDKIFALTASIIPFFTLTVGLNIFNNYDQLLFAYSILSLLGRIGIVLSILLILLIEFFILMWITRLIADHTIISRETKAPIIKPSTHEPLRLRLLEEPSNTHPVLEELQPAIEPVDSVIFELPETKPLASKEAYKSFQTALDKSKDTALEVSRNATSDTDEEVLQKTAEREAQENDQDTTTEQDKKTIQFTDPVIIQSEIHEVDKDLKQALTEAEKLAEAIEREKEAERNIHQTEAPADKPVTQKKNDFPITNYHVPVEGLLTAYPDGQYWIIDQATRDAAVILKETLKEFNIQAEVTGIRKGPVITMFEILPAPGVKLSKIVNLQDNIALRLAASSVRIVAPIPGKHAVGIEVPNRKRNIVSFREMIEGELHREGKRMEIPVILGKDITGEAQTIDLVQTPHLLIAGATGSGKSVCVNSMILSILYQRSPAEVRLMLIDPKIVELKLYNDIPHLLTPVITEPKRAFQALQYCIYEMERRYALLDSMGVRDIRSYNKRIKERNIATERLPYIVVVIDEFADLMATTGKELESTVARLAAMSRAVGIHLVLATQRPSIDVITGLIKANIPSRIAFMVASKMDSRIIIDMVGAEKLLGKGDMLYAGAVDPFPVRMQGAFVSEEEVERVVEYVKGLGEPDYIDDEIFYDEDEEEAEPSLFDEGDDPLYEKALEIVYQQGKASASYIQRRLKIGYNRAARIVEMMEERGIVGPAQGSKPRELLRGQ